MYNVNKEQIDIRLTYLPTVIEALRLLNDRSSPMNLIDMFALERAIHVAAECVTDIGNYMIDGFVMRDAASYEDIIEILYGEQVFPREVYDVLYPLVLLRKPLVQSYNLIDHDELINVSHHLPSVLERFVECIRNYLFTELGAYK